MLSIFSGSHKIQQTGGGLLMRGLTSQVLGSTHNPDTKPFWENDRAEVLSKDHHKGISQINISTWFQRTAFGELSPDQNGRNLNMELIDSQQKNLSNPYIPWTCLKHCPGSKKKQGATPISIREVVPSTLNCMDNRLSMISIERHLKFHYSKPTEAKKGKFARYLWAH